MNRTHDRTPDRTHDQILGTTPGRSAHRVLGALGAGALALVLAACGGGDDGGHGGGHGAGESSAPGATASSTTAPGGSASPGTAQEHNDADVTFARDMVVHHEGAIRMADLAAGRAGSQEVEELAARIRAAQGPEIETMNSWLEAWGEEPASGGGHGDHGGMPGMMSAEDLGALENASGAEFDRLFLEGMVEHHEGALRMARTEQAEGANPDAKALAGKIEADQTREIEEMRQMLGSL